MTNTPERPILHHHEILQFVDFQDGGCPSSWNFEIFNSQLLQRHFLHYHITFCGDRSNCCRDIVFRVFQVKNVKKFTICLLILAQNLSIIGVMTLNIA